MPTNGDQFHLDLFSLLISLLPDTGVTNTYMQPDIRLRVSVMGLFIQSDTVLMIHKMTGPEVDCWDLPGGGVQPGESLMQALEREIQEETGLTDFQVQSILTVAEDFFPNWQGKLLHSISIIYQCTFEGDPDRVFCTVSDPEVGIKGVQLIPIATLTADVCSTRSWKALQAAQERSPKHSSCSPSPLKGEGAGG